MSRASTGVVAVDVVVNRAAGGTDGVVRALVILVLWVVAPVFTGRRREENPR